MHKSINKYLFVIFVCLMMIIPVSAYAEGTDSNTNSQSNTEMKYIANSLEGISIPVSGTEKISSLTIDGVEVVEYTITDSSIKLSNTYLNTLSVGMHSVVLNGDGGSTGFNLEIIEEVKASFDVEVTDQDGNQISGAVFELKKDDAVVQTLTSDSLGKISVNNLVVGTYSFVLKTLPDTYVTTSYCKDLEFNSDKLTDSFKITFDLVKEESNETASIQQIVDLLPDYFFVSTKEDEAFSEKTYSEITEQVDEVINENVADIENVNYDLNISVNEMNHIFEALVYFTNEDNVDEYYGKSVQIVYSNSDDYVEEDNKIVSDFISNNELQYVNYYDIENEKFNVDEFLLDDVISYLDDEFENSNIDYDYKEIGYTENLGDIVNVYLFVNGKYYGVTGCVVNNGVSLVIPSNVYGIDDIIPYIENTLSEYFGTEVTYSDGIAKVSGYDVYVKYTTETTIDKVVDIISGYYELESLEDEVNLYDDNYSSSVSNEIIQIINDKLINNEIDLSTLGYNLEVDVDNFDFQSFAYDIYTGNIYIYIDENTNPQYTIPIDIGYKNSSLHNEEEEKIFNDFISNNDFNFEYHADIFEDLAIDVFDEMDKNLAELINDNNISVRAYDAFGGSSGYNFEWPYLFFINNKYYGAFNVSLTIILDINVSSSIDDVDGYVMNAVGEYFYQNGYIDSPKGISIDNNVVYDNNKNDIGIINIVYEFIDSKDSNVYEKASGDYSFEAIGELGNATSLSINNSVVDSKYYSINGNKLIINSSYLDSLENDNYNLHLETNLGYFNTDFVVVPKQYVYLEGANSVVIHNDVDSLVVRINAELNKFVSVYINGNELNADCYSLREGSTIIDIDPSYLKTLSAGLHEIKAVFTDGYAVTHFSIKDLINYTVSKIDNSNYIKNSNRNVRITLNNINSVQYVKLNGVVIPKNNYSVSNNSIVIKGDYLNNLGVGGYNASIMMNDGEANASFTVSNKTTTKTKPRKSTKTTHHTTPVKRYYVPNRDVSSDEVIEKVEEDKKEEEVEDNYLGLVDDPIESVDDTDKKITKKKSTKKEKSTTKKENTKTTDNTNKENTKKEKKSFKIDFSKIAKNKIFIGSSIIVVTGSIAYVLYVLFAKKDDEEDDY